MFGLAGVGASARLYLAPGRPAWNSPLTIFEFFASAALFGAMTAKLMGIAAVLLLPVCGLSCLLVLFFKLGWLALASSRERYGAWHLLSTTLLPRLLLRICFLTVGLWIFVIGQAALTRASAAALLLAGECLGRYLFFVSVVPTSIANGFFAEETA